MDVLTLKLHYQVFIGAVLGIAAGIVLGGAAQYLRPIGIIYVMLLDVVVYPYIICSLIGALGDIEPRITFRLFRSGFFVYLLLLALVFLTLFALVQAVPTSRTLTIHSVKETSHFMDIIHLLVPSNIFTALARNYVPAIIVFCVLFGLALQHYKKKKIFLNFLLVVRETSLKLWQWFIYLAPVAIFCLLADTIGTTQLATFKYYASYIVCFFIGALFLIFIIIPTFMSAFIPMHFTEIIKRMKGMLIIAIATTLSASALPIIEKQSREVAQKLKIEDAETGDIVKTSLTVAYPFGQVGNFFIYLYIYYAAFIYSHIFSFSQKVFLPVFTFLSGVGSPTSVVNSNIFLTHYLGLPNRTRDIFIEFFPITRYAQVSISVAAIFFMTALTTALYYKKARFCLKKVFIAVGLFVISLLIMLGLSFFLNHYFMDRVRYNLNNAGLLPSVTRGIETVLYKPGDKIPTTITQVNYKHSQSILSHILSTHILRVGYNPTMMPYSYINKKGNLVGLDIAYMYDLARSLNAKIIFIPYNWHDFPKDIEYAQFDVMVGAIFITPQRLNYMRFSKPYEQTYVSFLVKNQFLNEFKTYESIRKNTKLNLAIFGSDVLLEIGKKNFPNQQFTVVYTLDDFKNNPKFSALFSSYRTTSAFALSHLRYHSVIPQRLIDNPDILVAFALPKASIYFERYINMWLEKKSTKTYGIAQKNYWFYYGNEGGKKFYRKDMFSELFSTQKKPNP